MDYNTAKKLSDIIKKKIAFFSTHRPKIKVVGSLRRKEPIINDIDLLVVDGDLSKVDLSKFHKVKLLQYGNKRIIFTFETSRHSIISVDLFSCKSDELPYALFHYTGTKQYNIRTRAHAKNMGYLLNQYGLYKNGVKLKLSNVRTERDLAHLLGISYRVPSNRKK